MREKESSSKVKNDSKMLSSQRDYLLKGGLLKAN